MMPSRLTCWLSLFPAYPSRSFGLRSPFVCFVAHISVAQWQRVGLDRTPPLERPSSLYPRGPRSVPGYSVPDHQRFSAPSAPLAGTARLHRKRLIRTAFAVRERRGDPRVVPRFHCILLLDMSSSRSPESSPLLTQFLHGDTAFAQMTSARHSSTIGIFGAYRFTIATTCRFARLPEGDFYIQASHASVALRAAGYDYGGN